MSGINFNSWTENATRLGMRIQETLAERTRDFTLTGSGAGYYDTGEEKTKNIRSQLDSGNDREKLEAMKRLIAVSAYPSSNVPHAFTTLSLDDLKRPQRL
jgi:AP-3 complex subunit beta